MKIISKINSEKGMGDILYYDPYAPEWDLIPEKYMWVATDWFGTQYAYTVMPTYLAGEWAATDGEFMRIKIVAKKDNIDWFCSLRERPIEEEAEK